ncbi:hypothetical protein DM49_2138 [Burkholderia mallei]|nr:hypothetical protein DM75_2634 [Burkholderia mallei]KOS89816.1 hypothetical protein DM45_1841 [Burkholderia mallei]KOS95476.1 hypothetical protein DM49_2138 [Burkholderia mallei]KOT00382.1 hypothetical protein DM50_1813 [Burkholderia mallei]KOT05758.1 hypothetical protein DM77_1086 [Burkholderia mallei]
MTTAWPRRSTVGPSMPDETPRHRIAIKDREAATLPLALGREAQRPPRAGRAVKLILAEPSRRRAVAARARNRSPLDRGLEGRG